MIDNTQNPKSKLNDNFKFKKDFISKTFFNLKENNFKRMTQWTEAEGNFEYFSIADLNRMDEIDLNKIYKIKGYIVGINPSDWIYGCVKSYKFNEFDKKYELSDPFFRGIDIIISDLNPNDFKTSEKLLTPDNSITINIDDDELEYMIGENQIELNYLYIKDITTMFYKLRDESKIINFKIFKKKKKISLSPLKELSFWTAYNFKLSE